MRREADATTILRRLLDRHERGAGKRRIIERPTQSFESPADLRALVENLAEAEQAGAVSLVWDRDAPHLVERVVLVDPARLYAFTGRKPLDEIVAASISALNGVEAHTALARGLLADLRQAWAGAGKLMGLGPGDIERACAFVRAADAAFADLEPDTPLRTRSVRLLGDSKALERAMPSLLAYLRHIGVIASDLSADEAMERLGLAKYAQPVLVAGPLLVGDARIEAWPYAGVPPELVASVRPAASIRSILTIENLESFNRHVRSSRLAGDVVVYTGGFPSGAVLAMLRTVLAEKGGPVHHWGDIDVGGIRIGRHIETALSAPIVPHLMDMALARKFGRPADPGQLPTTLPGDSAFFALSEYLKQSGALWLEQEAVDPRTVESVSTVSAVS